MRNYREFPNLSYSALGNCWFVTIGDKFKTFDEMNEKTTKFTDYKEASAYWANLVKEFYRGKTV